MIKRFNFDLPIEQYEFLRRVAEEEGSSVAKVIRDIIADRQAREAGAVDVTKDSLYNMRTCDSGVDDLAERHDFYLYGLEKRKK